jgi:outer membrane putative beta-barrel porin/alpha-amylase
MRQLARRIQTDSPVRPSAAYMVSIVMITALAVIVVSPPARAQDDLINPDRPGIADGSTVVGARRVQLETGWQYEVLDAQGQRARSTSIPSLFRVGLSRHLEARVEGDTFTRVSADSTGAAAASGFAPLSAGLKYQLLDATGRQPSVGVIARVFPPSGTGAFKSNHAQADVRLAADWGLGTKLSLNPNAGFARTESDAGETFSAGLLALTLNYQPTEHLNPFVDVGAQVPGAPGEHASVVVDYGLAWIIGRNVQLDASVGHRVRGTAPHPFVALGFSVRGGRGTR